MNPMVTRCPKCATSFRITSTQLETANGKVRCGSCLLVFKALDHLVTSSTPETKPTKLENKIAKPELKASPTEAKTITAVKTNPTTSPVTGATKAIAKTVTPVESKSNQSSTTNAHSATKVAALNTKTTPTPAARPTPTAAPTVIRKTNSATVSQLNTTQPAAKSPTSLIENVANKIGKEASKPAPKKVLLDKAKVLEDEDDLLISDDMDKKSEKGSAYEFDGFIDLDLNPKQTVSLFEREIRYHAPADDKAAADESWAESLLEEEEALDRSPTNLREKINSSTTTPVITSAMIARKQQEYVEQAPQVTENSHSNYVSNAEEIDEQAYSPLFSLASSHTQAEKSDDDAFSDAFKKATTPSNDADNGTPNFVNLFGDEPESEELESSLPSNKRSGKSTYKIRMADTSRTTLLMNIMPAPVELTARKVRNWYQQKLWPSLAVLLSVSLFFQIAYFKFEYFSRVEPYRSIYSALGFTLPTLVDTKQIQTYHLVVRPHPDIQNALLVDATILNNAEFEQPFPDILLSFTTINNTPVASRRFAPKDYLGGELAGKQIMPSKVQVHLSLELTDPGPEAVNYTMNIAAN